MAPPPSLKTPPTPPRPAASTPSGRLQDRLPPWSASVEYGNARVEDRVRINPYNSFTLSTPPEQRTRQYVRTSELHLATQLYPLRAYVAAPDNALRGIIYNAMDNQNQEEIIEDLQAMNPSSTYAIADARQMGRTRSILITFVGTKELPRTVVFNCGLFICHPFRPKAEACFNCWSHGHRSDVCTKSRSGRCPRCGAVHATRDPPDCTPKCILCSGTHVTGSRPCKLRFERGGPTPLASSPKSTPSNSAQSTPSARDNRSSRPRQRSSSRSSQDRSPRHRSVSFPPLPGQDNPSAASQVSWRSQPPTHDPEKEKLKAQIAAQSNDIALLKEQLQALLARPHLPTSSPHQTSQPIALQTPPPPPPAPMSASSSAASSRAASPSRCPPHKMRSSTEPAATPEMEAVIRHTASFLEAHERRIMAAITALRTDTQSWMTQINNRMAKIEARQSSLEADLAQMTINVSSLLPSSSSPKRPAPAGAPRPQDGQTPPAP
ncbi:uncharacterized protein [Dermacentor albipictus]|uniref:uncharacterized protein n=1 Tax=Dermacentor albipictus TaxID=60249 RepID=UPI0038FC8AE7